MCLAIPGKIIEILNDDPLMRSGKVSFSGIIKEINLAFTPEAEVGHYVIAHAGFAISTLDEKAAEEILMIFE
ncbi:HypC/HybG/HupF family hydrogenase formation chaperone [bacterium]|nr:HypC/HybG/HupF family hydrogenase formation chaperone [FCB group bacterium]MBL7191274.1 HypC/HybG/HupF family hydrogenase formation chaperone [bacterium]